MNPGSSRRSVNVPPEKAEKTVQIAISRSEEHTSELQSRQYLVCRLLLEKKKIATHADLRIWQVEHFTDVPVHFRDVGTRRHQSCVQATFGFGRNYHQSLRVGNAATNFMF